MVKEVIFDISLRKDTHEPRQRIRPEQDAEEDEHDARGALNLWQILVERPQLDDMPPPNDREQEERHPKPRL